MTSANDFAAYARGEYDNSTIKGASMKNYNRTQKLMKRYGLTEEEYNAIKSSQAGVCAICSSDEELVVDHCHSGEHIRGLLCRRCNGALGMFKDDPILLKRAVGYLNNSIAR